MLFTSCENNTHQSLSDYQENSLSDFHQKRNPDIPTINYEQYAHRSPIAQSSSNDLGFIGWLGRTVKLNTFPVESMENLYFPIIDIERYFQDHPTSIIQVPILNSVYSAHSFSTFEEYYESSNTASTINAGIDLGVGANIFNFNASTSFINSFSITNTNVSEYVYGVLSIDLLKDKYSLSLSDNDLSTIIRGYLYDSFVENIYFSVPHNLLNNYGYFVTKDIITGGRLEMLYAAHKQSNSSTNTSSEELEVSLETTIMGMVSANGSYQINGRDSIYNNQLFSEVSIAYKLLGGNATLGEFSLPEDAEDFSLNTYAWEQSMQNADNYVISKYPNNSLVPIYTFIEEDNLKLKYQNILVGQGSLLTSLSVPNIQITVTDGLLMMKNKKLCKSFIYTRFGDEILLNSMIIDDNPLVIRNVVGLEFERLQEIFPDIEINSYNDYHTGKPGGITVYSGCEFDVDSLTKYFDNVTGKTYLLTTIQSSGKKVAYVLYNQDIIDEYTFNDIITQVPATDKSLAYIKSQYELIAL